MRVESPRGGAASYERVSRTTTLAATGDAGVSQRGTRTDDQAQSDAETHRNAGGVGRDPGIARRMGDPGPGARGGEPNGTAPAAPDRDYSRRPVFSVRSRDPDCYRRV